jgi:hypothetical protein
MAPMMLNKGISERNLRTKFTMNSLLLSISHILHFSWMSQSPTQLSAGLSALGFGGLLIGMIFTSGPEDPTDIF